MVRHAQLFQIYAEKLFKKLFKMPQSCSNRLKSQIWFQNVSSGCIVLQVLETENPRSDDRGL